MPKFKRGTAEIIDMTPAEKAAEKVDAEIALEHLRGSLAGIADVRLPSDAEEPILALPIRQAVHEWMVEVRSFAELEAVGMKPRSTTMLVGPPGCGKTTLAHHFAARLGYPLVVMETAAMNGRYCGTTSGNLSDLFNTVRDYPEPLVILLDEFDSMARERTSDNHAAAREQNSIVATLLTAIEAFKGILFAATNKHEHIDKAIWRRFGMQITIDLPDSEARFAILKRYGLPFAIHDDVIESLCVLTNGAAPALLRQLMEGLKRSLVLGPKLKRDINNLPLLLSAITASVGPHPDYDPPPLWKAPQSVKRLVGLPWPPERTGVA